MVCYSMHTDGTDRIVLELQTTIWTSRWIAPKTISPFQFICDCHIKTRKHFNWNNLTGKACSLVPSDKREYTFSDSPRESTPNLIKRSIVCPSPQLLEVGKFQTRKNLHSCCVGLQAIAKLWSCFFVFLFRLLFALVRKYRTNQLPLLLPQSCHNCVPKSIQKMQHSTQ